MQDQLGGAAIPVGESVVLGWAGSASPEIASTASNHSVWDRMGDRQETPVFGCGLTGGSIAAI
eukprot:COSAG02_NODE_131_length_34710_cov_17.171159_2_plen_63_part_00